MAAPILILVLLATGPAAGEARGRGPAEVAAGDRLVCRDLAESGSRLVKRRVCMSRDRWTEHRRLQRAELERMQVNAGIPGVD